MNALEELYEVVMSRKAMYENEAMKAPAGLLSRRPVCEANAACSARQGREARIKGCSPLIIPKKKALPKNRAVRQSAQTLFRFFSRADFYWRAARKREYLRIVCCVLQRTVIQ